jgi:8-oxo-dGTP diphosphatase
MATEVCAAIVRIGPKILVRRRPPGTHLAGLWEFPGGKRRPGERGRACAAREVREETGLRVRVGGEVARVRHRYPDRTVLLRFFDAVPVGGRIRGSRSLRWVTPAALRRLAVPPANRGLVARLTSAGGAAADPPRRGASGPGRRGRRTPRSRPTAR